MGRIVTNEKFWDGQSFLSRAPHVPDPEARAGLCVQALMILGGGESISSDLSSLGDGKTASSHTPGQKPLSGTHQASNNRSACLSPLAKLDFLFNNRVRFNSVVNEYLHLCYLT